MKRKYLEETLHFVSGFQAWDIKHITFIDGGNISYSNPVRQSLYNFEDSIGEAHTKVDIAVQTMKRIFPGVVRLYFYY